MAVLSIAGWVLLACSIALGAVTVFERRARRHEWWRGFPGERADEEQSCAKR